MASDEFDAGSPAEQIRRLLDQLKKVGGVDWYKKLNEVMTDEEREGVRKSTEIFADITKMSTRGLRAMQRAIHDRLIDEDKQASGQPKLYGVRDFPDWKQQADAMEAELDARGEAYSKVPW
jgi:hypothetical protein